MGPVPKGGVLGARRGCSGMLSFADGSPGDSWHTHCRRAGGQRSPNGGGKVAGRHLRPRTSTQRGCPGRAERPAGIPAAHPGSGGAGRALGLHLGGAGVRAAGAAPAPFPAPAPALAMETRRWAGLGRQRRARESGRQTRGRRRRRRCAEDGGCGAGARRRAPRCWAKRRLLRGAPRDCAPSAAAGGRRKRGPRRRRRPAALRARRCPGRSGRRRQRPAARRRRGRPRIDSLRGGGGERALGGSSLPPPPASPEDSPRGTLPRAAGDSGAGAASPPPFVSRRPRASPRWVRAVGAAGSAFRPALGEARGERRVLGCRPPSLPPSLPASRRPRRRACPAAGGGPALLCSAPLRPWGAVT